MITQVGIASGEILTLIDDKKMKTVSEPEKTVDADNFEKRVEKKAYELAQKRGFKGAHDWADWFEAEKIVEAELNTVDRDCIRSESLYKSFHRSGPVPADIV